MSSQIPPVTRFWCIGSLTKNINGLGLPYGIRVPFQLVSRLTHTQIVGSHDLSQKCVCHTVLCFLPLIQEKTPSQREGTRRLKWNTMGGFRTPSFKKWVGSIRFISTLGDITTLLINVLQCYCMDTTLHLEKNTKFQSQNRSTDTLLLFVLEDIKEGAELNFKCLDLLSVLLQNPWSHHYPPWGKNYQL